MRRPATIAVLLAAAPAAVAQPFDGTQGVDTFTGPVISSSRILGLAGAYVAVAEGLGGAAVNPAAVAQRNRHLVRGWDWDWLLTWYAAEALQAGRQDFGNDGSRDAGLSGVGNGQVGLSAQRGRFGVAVFGRSWNLSAPRDGVGSVEVEIAEASLAGGVSLRQDTVVLGLSVTEVGGLVGVAAPGAEPGAARLVEVEYAGSTLRFGALLRPRGRAWRIGGAFDPGARARAQGDRSALPFATPAEFVFPWVLSLGAARWIGPNARRFNEPPLFERRRHPEWGPAPEWEDGGRRPVLVTAQLDLVGPASGSVSIESALVVASRAAASGEKVSIVPRAGAEWEALPERLRVRGGTYLEPSRTGASPRPHGTFGVEVRIPFPWRPLQLGLSGDLAARFRNVALSLGFWSRLGAERPVPAAPPNPS